MLCVVVQRLLNRLHSSAWRGTQKSPEGTEVGNSKDDIVSEKTQILREPVKNVLADFAR